MYTYGDYVSLMSITCKINLYILVSWSFMPLTAESKWCTTPLVLCSKEIQINLFALFHPITCFLGFPCFTVWKLYQLSFPVTPNEQTVFVFKRHYDYACGNIIMHCWGNIMLYLELMQIVLWTFRVAWIQFWISKFMRIL